MVTAMEMAMPAFAGSGAMASLLLDGKCIVNDEFEGAVPFAGRAYGPFVDDPAVDERSVDGTLHWDTHPPGHVENVFGMKSLAGPGQRDVTLMLVDHVLQERTGGGKLTTLGLDFDFIRRLHAEERNPGNWETRNELLGIVMDHSDHFGSYDIQAI